VYCLSKTNEVPVMSTMLVDVVLNNEEVTEAFLT
jgi:hypothetical protein